MCSPFRPSFGQSQASQGALPISTVAVSPGCFKASFAWHDLRFGSRTFYPKHSTGTSCHPRRLARATLLASRNDEVASTRSAIERMQNEISRLEANLEKALNSSDQDCHTVQCPEQSGSSSVSAASQAPPTTGVLDGVTVTAAGESETEPSETVGPQAWSDPPAEVTHEQVEEAAPLGRAATETEAEDFEPPVASASQPDSFCEGETSEGHQVPADQGASQGPSMDADAAVLPLDEYESGGHTEPAEAQSVAGMSSEGNALDGGATHFDSAVQQLQNAQRPLQETPERDSYWVPSGSVEGAVVQPEGKVSGMGEEYWMPNGARLAESPEVDYEMQDGYGSLARSESLSPGSSSNSLLTDQDVLAPGSVDDRLLPDGAFQDVLPRGGLESRPGVGAESSSQNSLAPDNPSSLSSSAPDLPSPHDALDLGLQNWPPDGPIPEGRTLKPDAVPEWDSTGLEELQRAISVVEDAIGLPPDASTSAATSVSDTPQHITSLTDLAQRLDSIDGTVNAHGSSSDLSTVQALANELAARLDNWPQFWNPLLPIFGKVLAYILAAVGVGYLILGVSGSQRKDDRSDTVEPDSIIESVGDRSQSLDQESSKNTRVANWLEQSGVSVPDAETPTTELDNSVSLPGEGATDEESSGQEDGDRKNTQVLPWVLNELDSAWSGSFDVDSGKSASLSVSASYDDTTAVATVMPSGSAEDYALDSKRASNSTVSSASLSEDASDVYDSRVQDIDTLAYRRREARFGTSGAVAQRAAIKEKLWWVVRGLGPTAAIVPGGEPIRSDIEQLLSQLEDITPLETPLNIETTGGEKSLTTSTKTRSKPHPDLLGMWRLEYASNTQVVQKNAMQHVLQLAEAIPGFGVGDVIQHLRQDSEADQILTENSAVVGLGPFGSWQISVTGIWQDNGGGICAKANFQSFCVRPVEIMGFSGDALPEVRVPVPSELQAEVEWCTTYCDKEFRIGRGTTGNMFVFRKESNPAIKRKT